MVSIQPFRQREFEISPAGTAADRLNYLLSLNAKANPRKRLDFPPRKSMRVRREVSFPPDR
jgi:hypothetical protein